MAHLSALIFKRVIDLADPLAMDSYDRDPWKAPEAPNGVVRSTVLMVGGVLDEAEAPALAAAIGNELAGGPTDLIIDLSHVTSIDSVGLAVLMDGLKNAQANGGNLRLVRPASEAALRVFRLTRLDDVFETPTAA